MAGFLRILEKRLSELHNMQTTLPIFSSKIVTGFTPQDFENYSITISEKEDPIYIQEMKETNKIVLRLSNYIHGYDSFARFRITSIRAIFLDKHNMYLPRQKTEIEDQQNMTEISIRFPKIFTDTDTKGRNYTFYANLDYECQSSYKRIAETGSKYRVSHSITSKSK